MLVASALRRAALLLSPPPQCLTAGSSSFFQSCLPLQHSFGAASRRSSSSSTQQGSLQDWHKALDHPDYEWLKCPNEHTDQQTGSGSKLVGKKFLHVPYLGGARPKGLTSDDYSKRADGSMYLPFFLTSSRIALLERLHAITRAYRWDSRVSIAPAGPQGVGKSLYCYLVASYAAVNRFPLIYIPLITEWTFKKTHSACSRYFLTKFAALNKHWFPADGDGFYRELEEISELPASRLTPQQNRDIEATYESLLDCVREGFPGLAKTTPRFTVLDEHNELFRSSPRGEAPLAELEQKYFRPFCNWTLGGVTVLCGSAHSKFLSSMPGGTTNSIVELQPFTEDETVAYLTSEASPDRIPGLTDCQARQIFSDYGGVARILWGLKQSVQERLLGQFKDLESALADIRNAPTKIRAQLEMQNRFERYCREMIESDPVEKQKFTHAVQSWFFGRRSHFTFGECMLDPGMFYTTNDGIYPINRFATNIILKRYSLYHHVKPLSQCTPAELTEQLELAVLGSFLKGGTLEFTSLFAKGGEVNSGKKSRGNSGEQREREGKQGSFKFPGDYCDVRTFTGTTSFERLAIGSKSGVVAYHPPPGFPRVDFIIVDFREPRVYLLQTTVSDPVDHLQGSSAKDWQGFFGLTDKPGNVTWTSFCKKFELDEDTTPVDYIYITTKTADELKAPQDRPKNLASNVTVNILTRENFGAMLIVY